MAGELATRVAEAILTDRRGADYYQNTEILADFLKGQFGSTSEAATEVAKDISQDRQGADYYKDAAILASFLDGRLGSRG